MLSMLKTLSFFFLVCMANWAIALDVDSRAPIEITSDSAEFNDKEGSASYQGNVIITQGASKLEAESVEVSAKEKSLSRISATGSPARFTESEDDDTATRGESKNIIYDASQATLTFIGDAALAQANNSFSGERIVYDIKAKAIRAEGGNSDESRVKIQYHPNTPATQSEQNDTSEAPQAETSSSPAERTASDTETP